MTELSRGDSPSSYYPGFGGSNGIKSRISDLKGKVVSGTIISANVVYEISHTLGSTPNMVIVEPKLAADEAKNFTSGTIVSESKASAATSTKFYVVGNNNGTKFVALLLV